MKLRYTYLSLAMLSILASSCYTGPIIDNTAVVDESRQKENSYYVVSAPNSPLLSAKDELNFNFLRTTGAGFSGIDLQAGYLPGKHIGIMAGYSLVRNGGGYPDFMKYNRLEGGIGYITALKKGWHFETYAGMGSGNLTNYHYTGLSKINLTHFFLQPGVSFNNEKRTVQLGFLSRFAGVNFNVRDTLFSTSREPFSTKNIERLYDQPFHIMWEPGLVVRAGWKFLLFSLAYSHSANLTNPDLHSANNNFSFGFSLRFNTMENKKVN